MDYILNIFMIVEKIKLEGKIMECPYCHQNMVKGFINGDRYSLKWIEESRNRGSIISVFQKGLKLTNAWNSNQLEVYYCKDCKKMIINVNNKLK